MFFWLLEERQLSLSQLTMFSKIYKSVTYCNKILSQHSIYIGFLWKINFLYSHILHIVVFIWNLATHKDRLCSTFSASLQFHILPDANKSIHTLWWLRASEAVLKCWMSFWGKRAEAYPNMDKCDDCNIITLVLISMLIHIILISIPG